MRHERAIGIANDVNALGIDVVLRLEVVDYRIDVGDVINVGAKKIAAGVGGIPETVSQVVFRAIRVRIKEVPLVGEPTEPEELFLLDATVGVPVQRDHERRGHGAIIAAWDFEAIRPGPNQVG
jgi:hypothetical protein